MTELNFPCIKNKCLKYPACKSKIHIECTLLDEFFNNYWLYENLTSKDIWKIIEVYLPNTMHISGEPRKPTSSLDISIPHSKKHVTM